MLQVISVCDCFNQHWLPISYCYCSYENNTFEIKFEGRGYTQVTTSGWGWLVCVKNYFQCFLRKLGTDNQYEVYCVHGIFFMRLSYLPLVIHWYWYHNFYAFPVFDRLQWKIVQLINQHQMWLSTTYFSCGSVCSLQSYVPMDIHWCWLLYVWV